MWVEGEGGGAEEGGREVWEVGVGVSRALSSSECVCIWDPGPRGLPRLLSWWF